MHVWYCAEYFLIVDPESGPFHCEVHEANEGCQLMRLVSADALVIERENGEWPEWITDVDGPVWRQCGGTDDLLDDIYKAVNR